VGNLAVFCCQYENESVIAEVYHFTVPTATFRALYCFLVISHSRMRVLHHNAMQYPTSEGREKEGCLNETEVFMETKDQVERVAGLADRSGMRAFETGGAGLLGTSKHHWDE
jgi:hypothetical protein